MLTTAYERLDQLFRNIEASTLIDVAGQTPMYGYFRFIRMIFNETSDFLQDYLECRKFAANLIQLCFKYDEILFPVLGSAAPEGFLPGKLFSTAGIAKCVALYDAHYIAKLKYIYSSRFARFRAAELLGRPFSQGTGVTCMVSLSCS